MPVHDASGSNQDERLPPPRPERSQRHPEQLVQGSQSSARPLRVQSEQLPTESQVFEDEVLAGAKRADDPPEEMPERHNHGKNIIGTIRIQRSIQAKGEYGRREVRQKIQSGENQNVPQKKNEAQADLLP